MCVLVGICRVLCQFVARRLGWGVCYLLCVDLLVGCCVLVVVYCVFCVVCWLFFVGWRLSLDV